MRHARLHFAGLAVVAFAAWATMARAYDRYSVNRDATNCRACHGDFRADSYVSNHDGQAWSVAFNNQTYTGLHQVHRQVMLNADCDTCHSFGGFFPVFTNSSAGGQGFQPIGCAGCHGRTADKNPPTSGYSAGLRQHHNRNGVTLCATCHDDASPANYTPVAENVKPPYYFTPDPGHPNKPTDPCNPGGVGENVAGGPTGLDNNGDNVYDSIGCDIIFRNGFQL